MSSTSEASHNAPKRRRWIRRSLIALGVMALLFALTLYVAIPAMLPGAIVYAPNTKATIDPRADRVPKELARARHLRITVGPPKATLSCLLLAPDKGRPPRGTILVFHGIRDNKRSQLGTAKHLANKGFRVLLVDHRGHGRSSGRYLTYGVRESADMVQVLDLLQSRGGLARPVAALGYSYGGAVALQLAARDKRIAAVATVATFASLRDVLGSYVRRYIPVVGRLVSQSTLDEALARAGKLASFDPALADNRRAAAARSLPRLLLHGASDAKIPVAHAHAIEHAAKGPSELIVIPEANHVTIFSDHGATVRRHIDTFFDRWLR